MWSFHTEFGFISNLHADALVESVFLEKQVSGTNQIKLKVNVCQLVS